MSSPSNAASKTAISNYNPVDLDNGDILFEPTFPSTGPINKELAVLRNSEVPKELKKPGILTPEEDQRLGYRNLKSGQSAWVGTKAYRIFTARWLDEMHVKGLARAHDSMAELREILTKRGSNEKLEITEFEELLVGGPGKKITGRSYPLGFTVNPTLSLISGAPTNTAILADPSRVGRVTQLIATAAAALLEDSAPKDLLEHLNRQAEASVALTLGSEENTYFTTAQLNYSDADEVSLEISIGDVGALHVDARDDPKRWTVLLGLSNLPEGYWPGRTLITSLRCYFHTAPMTAAIFKAVHPHVSFGPQPMAGSSRPPYQSSLPGSMLLDPKKYALCRLMVVCYPKRAIIHDSPRLVRRKTPKILCGPNGLQSSLPDAQAAAIANFGTKAHQFGTLARLDAFDRAKSAQLNPSEVLPPASWFAVGRQWVEDGTVHIPSSARIQAVLDANSGGANLPDIIWSDAYERKVKESLSQGWFGGELKKGNLKLVESDEIGSSFIGEDPAEPTKLPGKKQPTKEEKAKASFECKYCGKRFPRACLLADHENKKHDYIETLQTEATLDPAKA